jgi:ankyrin repeat protein
MEEDGRCFSFVFLLNVMLVMSQFQAIRNRDIHQFRVALTVDNLDDVDSFDWTVLHVSVHKSHFECVKHCIEMGANVNARDSIGWTPLYMASICTYSGRDIGRKIGIVRALLDANAIVDAADHNGTTPLKFAIKNDSVELSKLLIDRGAKISNVELDKEVTSIPVWVRTFIES